MTGGWHAWIGVSRPVEPALGEAAEVHFCASKAEKDPLPLSRSEVGRARPLTPILAQRIRPWFGHRYS